MPAVQCIMAGGARSLIKTVLTSCQMRQDSTPVPTSLMIRTVTHFSGFLIVSLLLFYINLLYDMIALAIDTLPTAARAERSRHR